jgi:Ca2+-dependent lipid-binding protein
MLLSLSEVLSSATFQSLGCQSNYLDKIKQNLGKLFIVIFTHVGVLMISYLQFGMMVFIFILYV